jgi:hypothetical protein
MHREIELVETKVDLSDTETEAVEKLNFVDPCIETCIIIDPGPNNK